jgi:hypothetical protein
MNDGRIDLSVDKVIKITDLEHLEINNKDYTLTFKRNGVVIWKKDYQTLQWIGFIVYWIEKRHKIFLFCNDDGLCVYRLSLEIGVFDEIVQLNRNERDDPDFYRNDFVSIENGCLFIYEGGLVKFNTFGDVCWKITHQYIDRFFTGIRGKYILYESEHEGKWAYHIDSGERINL